MSSQFLAIDLQRISPQPNNVDDAPLCCHVLCIMKNNNFTHCCVTHKAQNAHYEQRIIDDFILQNVMGRYSSDMIINMNETNVDFDPSPKTILCRIRERSVNAHINGHSGRCTVVLACTMSRIALPAWIIWEGVEWIRNTKANYINVAM